MNFYLKVLSVYEQVRNLISNLRTARIQGRQSLCGVSLHTSIASSDSSDHLVTHFKVSIIGNNKGDRRFCLVVHTTEIFLYFQFYCWQRENKGNCRVFAPYLSVQSVACNLNQYHPVRCLHENIKQIVLTIY